MTSQSPARTSIEAAIMRLNTAVNTLDNKMNENANVRQTQTAPAFGQTDMFGAPLAVIPNAQTQEVSAKLDLAIKRVEQILEDA